MRSPILAQDRTGAPRLGVQETMETRSFNREHTARAAAEVRSELIAPPQGGGPAAKARDSPRRDAQPDKGRGKGKGKSGRKGDGEKGARGEDGKGRAKGRGKRS